MTMDPDLPLNCPKCGRPLHYVEMTPAGAHIYECARDGTFTFTQERGLEEGAPRNTVSDTPRIRRGN
jgi:hypothetical protein